ncbi:MAG: hypothetical protein ACI9US_002646, partial [Gammaproteobacteria bacterium]
EPQYAQSWEHRSANATICLENDWMHNAQE